MDNEDDKYEPDELEILMNQVDKVESKKDLLKILSGISEICMKDKESWGAGWCILLTW